MVKKSQLEEADQLAVHSTCNFLSPTDCSPGPHPILQLCNMRVSCLELVFLFWIPTADGVTRSAQHSTRRKEGTDQELN